MINKWFMFLFVITGIMCYADDFQSKKIPPEFKYQGIYPVEMNYDSLLQFRRKLISAEIKIGDKYEDVLNKLGSPNELIWNYRSIKVSDDDPPIGFGIRYMYYKEDKICAAQHRDLPRGLFILHPFLDTKIGTLTKWILVVMKIIFCLNGQNL